MAWGDLMHVAAIQFPDPSVIIRFDTDSAAATTERQKAFAEAAEHSYWVAGAHLSFPGIGHLRAAGNRLYLRADELQRAALTRTLEPSRHHGITASRALRCRPRAHRGRSPVPGCHAGRMDRSRRCRGRAR